jgi:hypothetical protein
MHFLTMQSEFIIIINLSSIYFFSIEDFFINAQDVYIKKNDLLHRKETNHNFVTCLTSGILKLVG